MKMLLKISFDGSGYAGFQFQKNAPTVQGVLTEAASGLYGRSANVTGCSRTDAGVHAAGFCATVDIPGVERPDLIIPASALPRAFNARLPEDISVLSAIAVPDDFHPRYSAIDKTYRYLICASPLRLPLLRGRVFFPKRPVSPSAVEIMAQAARRLEGKRDFASFMASGSKILDTVRTVKKAEVTEKDGIITVLLCADGFLYNMVRIISGTLLETGLSGLSPDSVDGVIAARDRKKAGATLPPYGLYLCSVNYGDEYSFPDTGGLLP